MIDEKNDPLFNEIKEDKSEDEIPMF